MKSERARTVAVQIGIVATLVAAWETVSLTGLWLEDLFPSPRLVLASAAHLLREGAFFAHLAYSGYELLLGLSIGMLLGLGAGLALGASRFLGNVFEPLVMSLAPVPKIIIYPIFLWFLGIGTASRVAMGVASTFFPVAIYMANAVRHVSRVHIEAATLLGAKKRQLVTAVLLPAMLPFLWVGLRLGVAVSIVGILLAETKVAQKGLGFLLIEFYHHFQIEEMYAVLLLIFCIAAVVNSAFGWAERRIRALRQATQNSGGF